MGLQINMNLILSQKKKENVLIIITRIFVKIVVTMLDVK